MSHLAGRPCGHPLPSGGWCRHLITRKGPDCGRHRSATVADHPLDVPAQGSAAVASRDPLASGAATPIIVPARCRWLTAPGQPPPVVVTAGHTWLFDVDGTLADVESARHHLDARPGHPANMDAFHRAGLDCPPHEDVAELARDVHAAGGRVIVLTARDDLYGRATALWCHANTIPFEQVLTRPHRDGRGDREVKQDLVDHLTAAGHTIEAAVDDNPQVLALWADQRIPALAVPGSINGFLADLAGGDTR